MEKPLSKKLHYKQGRAGIFNAPDGYTLDISTESELEGKFDFVQVFVLDKKELNDWLPQIIPLFNDDAVVWVCYPKKSSKIKTDVNRDIIWQIVKDSTPYTLVSNVAVDETWSALRLRHKDKTKSK